MKKVLFVLYVLFIASCSTNEPTAKIQKSQVVGNWTLDYMWKDNSWQFIGLINWRLILKDDGTYSSHSTNDYVGTWSISSDNIVCKSGTVTVNYKVDSISANNAIIEMSYPPATDYIKFKVSK
jgi:heat shock protein HslJ